LNIYRVNTCPFQGSRTIRTEEAVLLTLARMRPYVIQNSDKAAPAKTEVIEKVEFSDVASDESSEED